VRVLIVSGAELDAADPLGAAALAAALRTRAEVRVVAPGGQAEAPVAIPRRRLPGALGRDATLAALAARVALREKPDAALVFAGPGARSAPAALAALRVPVTLLVADGSLGPGFLTSARFARALVALDPEVPPQLAERTGIRGISVLGGGLFDLDDLPTGTRAAAREQIGLERSQRFLAVTGDLDAPARLDLLALAHRKLAGVGLLVIGTGDQDARVAAMSAATRPSSPVLHIPTLDLEARRIALQAADVALALRPEGVGEDAYLAAALGRVVVALDAPGLERLEALYPGLGAVTRVPEPSPDALEASIRAGLERADAPLPPRAVDAARRSLARGRPVDQLLEVLETCASSS
jgi:hypothetical protein